MFQNAIVSYKLKNLNKIIYNCNFNYIRIRHIVFYFILTHIITLMPNLCQTCLNVNSAYVIS